MGGRKKPQTEKPPQKIRKPCKFFNSPQGCNRGKDCQFLHSKQPHIERDQPFPNKKTTPTTYSKPTNDSSKQRSNRRRQESSDEEGDEEAEAFRNMMRHLGPQEQLKAMLSAFKLGMGNDDSDFDDEDDDDDDYYGDEDDEDGDDIPNIFCYYCGEDCESLEEMDAHMDKDKHYACQQCCIIFDDKETFATHCARHIQEHEEILEKTTAETAEFVKTLELSSELSASPFSFVVPFFLINVIELNYGLPLWKNTEVKKIMKEILEMVEINLNHKAEEEQEEMLENEDYEPSKMLDIFDIMFNPKNPAKVYSSFSNLHTICQKESLLKAQEYAASRTNPPANVSRSNYAQKCYQYLNSGGSIEKIATNVKLGAIPQWPSREYKEKSKTNNFVWDDDEDEDEEDDEEEEEEEQKKPSQHNNPRSKAADINEVD